MWWLCTVWVDGDEYYRCAVRAGNDYYASKLAREHYKREGEFVVETEMFDTFEHGDPEDYEIVS